MPPVSATDSDKNERLLTAGAGSFHVKLSPFQIKAFRDYLSLLSFWGARLNLTAIHDEELVVRRHFIDSLSVVPLLSCDGSLLDIGSGAGFPGIPIKLAVPDKPVYLVEPRRKRANFLRQVARELKLTALHVIESRIEDLDGEALPPIAETITRGFSDIHGFLRISGGLLAAGGRPILMQGPKGVAVLDDVQGELPELGIFVERTVSFKLPFGGERRTVLMFKKS